MAKITLCANATFFDRLFGIKEALEKRGHEIFLPSMKDFHHLDEAVLAEISAELIKDHFAKIDRSDAIYVANYEKNEIPGYIGGNCFLEMGKAFDKGIPIFLMHAVPERVSYRDELLSLRPQVIGENWEKIILKKA